MVFTKYFFQKTLQIRVISEKTLQINPRDFLKSLRLGLFLRFEMGPRVFSQKFPGAPFFQGFFSNKKFHYKVIKNYIFRLLTKKMSMSAGYRKKRSAMTHHLHNHNLQTMTWRWKKLKMRLYLIQSLFTSVHPSPLIQEDQKCSTRPPCPIVITILGAVGGKLYSKFFKLYGARAGIC